MPQILHVHAKFYDIDENGQEPAIDYPELVRVFVEGGYRGYWSSEWEGHAFAELGEVDPLRARAQAARPDPQVDARELQPGVTTELDVTETPDFRRMPIADAVRWLAEHGEPADPRTDIDTASLKRRFPHLAAVETADIRIDGPHRRLVPARLYRDAAAAASGRALVWVHGGAFIGGLPRHARGELGRARARRARHPGALGRLRQVPRRRALSRADRRGAHGVGARACACGRALRGRRRRAAAGRGERGRQPHRGCGRAAAGCRRAGARRADPRVSRRAPERSRGVGRGRPRVAARAARDELRRLRQRLCATRTRSPRSGGSTGSRRRSSSSARRTTCAPRARRSRVSSRMPASRWTCTSSLVPATATSTSRRIRRRCRRSRRSPNGSGARAR